MVNAVLSMGAKLEWVNVGDNYTAFGKGSLDFVRSDNGQRYRVTYDDADQDRAWVHFPKEMHVPEDMLVLDVLSKEVAINFGCRLQGMIGRFDLDPLGLGGVAWAELELSNSPSNEYSGAGTLIRRDTGVQA